MFKILMGVGTVLIMATNVPGQVVLNEILADNYSIISNGDAYPDYIELYNPSTQAVDLGGWSLTDNLAQPRKYVFPTNTVLGPGEYLLVWCDTLTSAPGLHTGFALNNQGEAAGLYDTGSVLRDSVVFGLQLTDWSLGRVPNATGAWTLTVPTPGLANQAQPLGDVTALRFNEWMANATPNPDWLEVYNRTNLPVAVGGLLITDQTSLPLTNRPIPALSFIGPNGFIQFIADDLAKTSANHLDFKLSSSNGETLTLYAANGVTVLDTVTFGPQTLNVSQGRLPDGGTNIIFFRVNEATPEQSNFLTLTNVVVNEILTHTDSPFEDAVEFFNPTATAVDLGNWWLSNNRNDPMRYRIPAGTVIPARGFKVFYQYQFDPGGLGFTFNSYEAGEVVLASGNASGVLTGEQLVQTFGPAQNGISFGRFETSRGVDFVAGAALTLGVTNPASLAQFRTGVGATNAYPLLGPVIINEIMYHPPDQLVDGVLQDNTADEYLELFNAAYVPTPLYDPLHLTNQWRLRNGVSFDFPSNVTMSARSYLLVVSFSPTNTAQADAFRAKYHVPTNVMVMGPYSGKLDNRGEQIELYKPDAPQLPDRPRPGLVPYILVDRVAYEDRAPWPDSPDGTGDSLQRRSALVYGNDPVHWLGAPPTAGRPNVVEPPLIKSAVRTPAGDFRIGFTALAGVAYAVAWQTILNGGSPTTLTNIPATTDLRTLEVIDPDGPGINPGRFYRVSIPSQL